MIQYTYITRCTQKSFNIIINDLTLEAYWYSRPTAGYKESNLAVGF